MLFFPEMFAECSYHFMFMYICIRAWNVLRVMSLNCISIKYMQPFYLLSLFVFKKTKQKKVDADRNFHKGKSDCVCLWVYVSERVSMHASVTMWYLYLTDIGSKQKQAFLEHLITQWNQMKAQNINRLFL